MAFSVLDNIGRVHRDEFGIRRLGVCRRAMVEYFQGRPEQATSGRSPDPEQDPCQRGGEVVMSVTETNVSQTNLLQSEALGANGRKITVYGFNPY